jgi:hypothetical protein
MSQRDIYERVERFGGRQASVTEAVIHCDMLRSISMSVSGTTEELK